HRCCDEPGHQVEAQSAEGRRSHLRSVADLGSFEGRMGTSGGAHAEVCTAVYGAGRTMGIEGQRNWQEYCLLCCKGATAGHLVTDNHNKAMASWERRGRLSPQVQRRADFCGTGAGAPDRMVGITTRESIKARCQSQCQASHRQPPRGLSQQQLAYGRRSRRPSRGGPHPRGHRLQRRRPHPRGHRLQRRRPHHRGATMERPKKKLRQRPWPDTIGVARRSTAALEGARPLDPLAPQVLSSSEDSDDRWGHWTAKPLLPRRPVKSPKASGTMAPETPPKAVPASPKGAPSPKAASSPRAAASEAASSPKAVAPKAVTPKSVAPLLPPRPSSAPLTPTAPLPPPAEGPYQCAPMSYAGAQHRAILSSPSGESFDTREMM
ncbi:unnamed protein product, partial [Symbiodinium microadriaticum]